VIAASAFETASMLRAAPKRPLIEPVLPGGSVERVTSSEETFGD
jgi:hypothetical protein